MESNYVYALGTVDARFPNLSLEKEFRQAQAAESQEGEETGRQNSSLLTDRQLLNQVLSQPENRYIARDMCWVFTIENIDTYILQPRTNDELTQLIDILGGTADITFSEGASASDVDVIIGARGNIASPEMFNGLQLPIVLINKTYSFPISEFTDELPVPDNIDAATFRILATNTFHRMLQLADNMGNLDEHRAVNYLALRYPAIYQLTAERSDGHESLSQVTAQLSPLSANGARKVIEVIFTYRNNSTDVKRNWYASVDVSDMFPFLIQKLQPYYDRV